MARRRLSRLPTRYADDARGVTREAGHGGEELAQMAGADVAELAELFAALKPSATTVAAG